MPEYHGRPSVEWTLLLNGCYLYVSYDAEFVQRLKEVVPASEREYQGNPHYRWFVGMTYAYDAIGIAQLYFGPFTVPERPDAQRRSGGYGSGGAHDYQREYQRQSQPPPRASSQPVGPYAELYVASNAPAVVIRAAYRALAKLYHPDAGGSAAKMQALNAAYEQLQKEGKA